MTRLTLIALTAASIAAAGALLSARAPTSRAASATPGAAARVRPREAPQEAPTRSRATPTTKRATLRHGEGIGEPEAMYGLVGGADSIVLGEVTGVFRRDYTPIGSRNLSAMPHTVSSFRVERWLRSEGQLEAADEIKVRQQGAVLPDLVEMPEGRPLLQVGARYLLFLRSPDVRMYQRFGGVPCRVGGAGYSMIDGLAGYLDEYLMTAPVQGMVMIQHGMCVPSADQYQTARVMPFIREDEDLFQMNEEQAVRAVLRGLNEWRKRNTVENPAAPDPIPGK